MAWSDVCKATTMITGFVRDGQRQLSKKNAYEEKHVDFCNPGYITKSVLSPSQKASAPGGFALGLGICLR